MSSRNHATFKPPPTPRCWALIACAGLGKRAETATPKQYQMLAGQPLVRHTLAAFADIKRIHRIFVVAAFEDAFFRNPKNRNDAAFSVAFCGGASRAESVINGLDVLLGEGAAEHDWVLVHDAARCLVTAGQIRRLLDACWDDEVGGLLAVPLTDTLKVAQSDRVLGTLARTDKWLAQTPQMFRIGQLHQALELADAAVTDESSAIEAMGLTPKLVPGSVQNFKLTYPADFTLAQLLLQARQSPD